MSPLDKDAYFNKPDLFTPNYDEIHISVSFSWDIEKARWLKEQWGYIAPVKIGGPSIDGEPTNGFKAGVYLKKGTTITSRGCPNHCPWCFVRRGLIELDNFPEGNVIQDNNLLACSDDHLNKVFQMLSHQKRIDFCGGLEPSRITDKIIDKLRGLSVYQLWLSYDQADAEKPLTKAIEKLKKHFRRNQIRCYVLIGFYGDDLESAEARLKKALDLGALPFAMRYRAPKTEWKDSFLFNAREWNLLARKWTRPAIMKTEIKDK